MKKFLLLGLVLALLLASQRAEGAEPSAAAETQPELAQPSLAEELGYGFGSVLANIFYMPAKVTYAGLGLITGGLGFVLSAGNPDVANNIINPAVRGHYVVTPRHLKGLEPLFFVGPNAQNAEPPPPPQAASQPPPY